MMRRATTALLFWGLVSGFLTGCASLSAQPDPSRFFTLTPLVKTGEGGVQVNPGHPPISLGIGPVTLPGYLDREQLVTRISQNRFAVAENDRWAEPLADNFTRVLVLNLSSFLGTDSVVRYPWQRAQRPTYQVEVEVLRFEADAAYQAQLSARWTLRETASRQVLEVKESRLTRPPKHASTEESVAALSEALAELSREIAESTRAVAGKR
jgi:uncharacterized lipoprotein YmbA